MNEKDIIYIYIERERERMEDDYNRNHSQIARKWLEELSKGASQELETLALGGLQIELVESGLIRCKFLIPQHLSDIDENWHPGAIAVLIDDVGAATICSAVGHIKVSVSFDISYFSTAQIQEEVEIEGRVIGHKNKLSLVVVVIRKKDSGEMVALGKQWMASVGVDSRHQPSKL